MIIKQEQAGSIFGVNGRFFGVTKGVKEGTFTSQKWISETRRLNKDERVKVEIRFDDMCRNGHNTFSITGDIFDNHGRDVGGGCIHDEIAECFPELKPLIKWHLVSSDGPMHYVNNTVYHASDRDHRGKKAGEPYAWTKAIQFDSNPIKHKMADKFWQFLKDSAPYDFEVLAINADNKPSGYQFEPKFTFGGYGDKWHDCPFDTEQAAIDFLTALQSCSPQFVQIPTLFSEGKKRDLDTARACGVWPDATDAELMQESEQLKAALLARLPALQAEFKAAMLNAGFLWGE